MSLTRLRPAADILEANDSLTQVINLYRQLVKGEEVSKDGTSLASQQGAFVFSDLTVIVTVVCNSVPFGLSCLCLLFFLPL